MAGSSLQLPEDYVHQRFTNLPERMTIPENANNDRKLNTIPASRLPLNQPHRY